MVTVWWSAAGVLDYNFMNPGETITAEKDFREIYEMHRKLREKQPALFNRKRPILLRDNATNHVSQRTLRKFALFTRLVANGFPVIQIPRQLIAGENIKHSSKSRERLQRIYRLQGLKFLPKWNNGSCFSLAKVYRFLMASVSIIKVYSKLSCTLLKFKVEN
jgi:hypothetical protein